MPKRKLPRVELLNVPSFHQGSFDSLCTYYSAAMMLAALFPEEWREFGFGEGRERTTKKGSVDPFIRFYSDEDRRLILARWFYQGEYVEGATRIMNKIMEERKFSTRFGCRRETAHDNTFTDVIAGNIDAGLPVMLGWNTPDYGDHTVLVTGYWEGRERWLVTNDPMHGAGEMSWDSLKVQKTAKFEVGFCRPETHQRYRPMKRTEAAVGSATTVSRWSANGYVPIGCLRPSAEA